MYGSPGVMASAGAGGAREEAEWGVCEGNTLVRCCLYYAPQDTRTHSSSSQLLLLFLLLLLLLLLLTTLGTLLLCHIRALDKPQHTIILTTILNIVVH